MDWVPLDLSTTRDALRELTSMQDRGEWITGFFQGASGALLAGAESDHFLQGFDLGSASLANAEGNRAKISEVRREAAMKRWSKLDDHTDDAIAYAKGDAIAYAKPMHKTRQDKTEQKQETQQTKTTPSESEWVSYCSEKWPEWHSQCAADSFAYYQSVGWMAGKVKIKDWKAAARTAHGKAVQWGALQPKGPNGAQRGRVLSFEEATAGLPTFSRGPAAEVNA